MRTSTFKYLLIFLIGVFVGILIAYLIIASMPDYPYVHGLIA